MSYLNDPKIIFTGDFKADVSTVNNDVRHYDNASFEERFQRPGTSKAMNGWWNPEGGANFTFQNCTVKKGFSSTGPIVSSEQDLIIGTLVSGSIDKSPGKMVDLDPQMQMTSELWAISIRFSAADGTLLLEGDLEPTGFRDLQMRQFPKDNSRSAQQNYNRNGQARGGSWTSVLKNLKWGKTASKSPLLKALKSKTEGDQLSVNLNAFGYYYSHLDGRFSMGKIIGTIGPWSKTDPILFAPARRLYGLSSYFGYSNYIYDEANQLVDIDLGNSYPINGPEGTRAVRFTEISFGVSKLTSMDYPTGGSKPVSISSDSIEEIGTLDLKDNPNWLMESGGIISFDVPEKAQKLLINHQMVLYVKKGSQCDIYARESIKGLFLRADKNVFRIDPPVKSSVRSETTFFAYQWGKPLPGVEIDVVLQPTTKASKGSTGPFAPKALVPGNNFPREAIKLSKKITTDANGTAKCILNASNPGNPRGYINGQMYFYNYKMKGVNDLDQYMFDWLFVHLREAYAVPKKPTWKEVAPIWIQFGNLYPIMSKYIVDMSVRENLLEHKNILLYAFTRDINEPMYMPVTRDMSKGQQEALIKWLKDPSGDKKLTKTEMKTLLKRKEPVVLKSLKSMEENPFSDQLEQLTRAKGGDLSKTNS